MLISTLRYLESGRFVPNQKTWMERAYISDTSTIPVQGRCVAMYRIKNKAIDVKNVADVIIFFYFFVILHPKKSFRNKQ